MMKEIYLAVLLLFMLASAGNGQSVSYGVSAGAGTGTILRKPLIGGPSYDLNTGFSLGFQHTRPFARGLSFLTGLHWYSSSVTATPNFYPDADMASTDHKINLLYIPLLLKANFAKFFYLTGGLIGDLDVSNAKAVTNQSGVGASVGFGSGFLITDHLSIQVDPYLNVHGLLLTKKELYPERILDVGVRLGLSIQK